jgi:hypothetical protein
MAGMAVVSTASLRMGLPQPGLRNRFTRPGNWVLFEQSGDHGRVEVGTNAYDPVVRLSNGCRHEGA